MDFAQTKILAQDLEDALFLWEENRFSNTSFNIDLFIQSFPNLENQIPKAISELKEMDWLLDSSEDFNTDTSGQLEVTKNDFSTNQVRPPSLLPRLSAIEGYTLVKRIGRGSFGEVWQATGPGNIPLAMKIIPMEGGLDVSELRSLNLFKNIHHPHLLSIFGFWFKENHLWIAMELAEINFLEYVQTFKPTQEEIFSFFSDAAETIDFLNQKRHISDNGEKISILHRDIKPQNMLVVGGSLKIGDYGLARILDEEKNEHSGCMTPSYSPPEFFNQKMSLTSDQYSLAITYCKILGGKVPFEGNAAEVMAGHCNRIPDLAMLPMDQRWVVAKALEKNPLQRWKSCSEFIRELKQTNFNSKPKVLKLNRRYLFTALFLGFGLLGIGFFSWSLLGQNQGPKFEEIILAGHRGEVSCVCISEDSKIAISGSMDKQIIVWDLENQKAKLTLNEHTKNILSIAISKDNKQALSGGAFLDNRIILWDLVKGTKIKELIGHQHGVRNLVFLPDGKRAISCSLDCTARLWDLETGEQIHFFEYLDTGDPKNLTLGSPRQVWHMDISEDGKTMVCCLRDGKICVYDVESGKRTKTLNGPDQVYSSFSMNMNGTMGITSFGGSMFTLQEPIDLKIFRWDLITGNKEMLMEAESRVNALFFPKSTNDLYAFPKQGYPIYYDLNRKYKTTILSHLDSEVNCITGNAQGTKLALGCKDFSVRLLKRY